MYGRSRGLNHRKSPAPGPQTGAPLASARMPNVALNTGESAAQVASVAQPKTAEKPMQNKRPLLTLKPKGK